MKKIIAILVAVVVAIAAAVGVYLWVSARDSVVNPLDTNTTIETTVTSEAPGAPEPDQMQFHIEKFLPDPKVNAEYITVTGMPDEAVQTKLNGLLRSFYIGAFENKGDAYTNTETYAADYVVVQNYLCATREISTAYPERDSLGMRVFDAQVYHLTTGEIAANLLPDIEQVKVALLAGKFTQTHPADASSPEAVQIIADSISGEFPAPFYLTKDSLGLYYNGEEAAQGDTFSDYWRFEAKLEDLQDVLNFAN